MRSTDDFAKMADNVDMEILHRLPKGLARLRRVVLISSIGFLVSFIILCVLGAVNMSNNLPVLIQVLSVITVGGFLLVFIVSGAIYSGKVKPIIKKIVEDFERDNPGFRDFYNRKSEGEEMRNREQAQVVTNIFIAVPLFILNVLFGIAKSNNKK